MGENQLVYSSYPLETLSPGAGVICVKVVNKAHVPVGIEQCVRVTVKQAVGSENLAYARTQVIHNFGAAAVLGGAVFTLWPAPQLCLVDPAGTALTAAAFLRWVS